MIVDADGLIPIRCRSESHGIRGEAECKRLRLMPFRGSWPPIFLDFPFFSRGVGCPSSVTVRVTEKFPSSISVNTITKRSDVHHACTYAASVHGTQFDIEIDEVPNVVCSGQVG